MSIRVAVIGAGVMGREHARIVAQEIPGARLQVVCDAAPERAREVADDFGAADVSQSPLEVIGRKDVDAILIASPDQTHPELCVAAIEVGKPALCEKPLAPGVQGCLEVIAAERRAGRRWIQLGFMRRYDPSYTQMKRLLLEGAVGRALMLHCVHRNVVAPPSFSGQMAISNSAPHEFDIARYLLDTDISAITVYCPSTVGKVETVAPVFMVAETAAGQLVDIEINNNAGYGYDVRGELVGEKGSIGLRPPVHTVLNAELSARESYPADWIPRFAEAYRLQDRSWIGSIDSGSWPENAASCWDGYNAALIAEAAVRSLLAGGRVTIANTPVPAPYAGGDD